MTKIKGSRTVVTGAGSGIGQATALLFAQLGAADVICIDINAETATATAASCQQHGADAIGYLCDTADSAAINLLAEKIEAERGPVDILVNNAGVALGGPFLEQSTQDWNWIMGVNLHGVSYGCQAFGKAMVERGSGHVVNISSGAAYVMSRENAAYCASKAGVVAFSRCLRADWAKQGVGVSVICPGVINTPIMSNGRLLGRTREELNQLENLFQKYGHSPTLVASAIVSTIKHNREQVAVGIESKLLYRLMPLIPRVIQSMITRRVAI